MSHSLQAKNRARSCTAVGLAFSMIAAGSCASERPSADVGGSRHRPAVVHAAPLIARVGAFPITASTYEHWMAIGAATVEIPKPNGPLPAVVPYEPPDFTTCVRRRRRTAPTRTHVSLRADCRRTYDSIQRRILKFLITGYWIRGEAAAQHIAITEAEVDKRLEEERRATNPTEASFHRLQEASRQTTADLVFAVKTQMLSARLLARFTRADPRTMPERETIAAFNRSMRAKWIAKTSCETGYIVPQCRQYTHSSRRHRS
jgi:hypothetical protein